MPKNFVPQVPYAQPMPNNGIPTYVNRLLFDQEPIQESSSLISKKDFNSLARMAEDVVHKVDRWSKDEPRKNNNGFKGNNGRGHLNRGQGNNSQGAANAYEVHDKLDVFCRFCDTQEHSGSTKLVN